MKSSQVRLGALIIVTSTAAVLLVFAMAVASIGIVFVLKTFFAFIVQILSFVMEVIVAVVAAITSGATVTLSILAAAGAAAVTFPASSIQGRIGVSMAVSSAGIVASSTAVLCLATLKIDTEVAAAVVSAAAMSVAIAAAWAVGVMSLIEKETHQVGLKMTSILDTVRHNNHRILKLLLKLHVGWKQKDLNIALLHAVKAGYPECIEVLLAAEANPDSRDSYDNTPLLLACETGSYRLAKMLLDSGAKVDLQNGSRGTALHQAANWGSQDCVRLLLAHAADPNAQDGQWRTPLMLAAMHAHHSNDIMSLLIDAGCDVNMTGSNLMTALHYAATRGLDLETLLAAGANAHALDSGRNTALHAAAASGHCHVITRLLRAGCDVRAKNYQLRTALHLASMKGDVDCMNALMTSGADTYVVDASGNLPVWYSAYNGHYQATVHLIRSNTSLRCDPSLCPSPQTHINNPLMAALDKRHMDIARVLLVAGCDSSPLGDWLAGMSAPNAWTEDNSEHINWLESFLQTPHELTHLCRLTIRDVIGARAIQHTEQLPLPKKLQEFVTFSELLLPLI